MGVRAKQPGSGGSRSGAFTRVRRLPELARDDIQVVHEILDAASHCHIAHVVDGRPVATPTLHWRIGDRVYWHGSVASRMLRATGSVAEVCLTATVFDGWVLARSAFNHSANYRSVMCFGRPEAITDPAAKALALETFTERLFPGRWARLRPVSHKELGATLVLSLPLTECSAKVSAGPPKDPERDCSWPVWAGVIPLDQRAGRALAAPGLAPGLKPPRLAARRPAASR